MEFHSSASLVSCALLTFLAVVTTSEDVIQTVGTTFTTGKALVGSHKTIQPYSKVQCVRRCFEEGRFNRCSIAGYNKATRACYLSIDDYPVIVDTPDESSGVFFNEELQGETTDNTCSSEEALVSGNSPIPDASMTATSDLGATWKPYYARLHGPNAWSASAAERGTVPPNFYIQVQFLALSTVVAVETQGKAGGIARVSSYRLQYSVDCGAFNGVLDAAGNEATFAGNTDDSTVVRNQLATPVTAVCVRLYPLTWDNYPNLRLEVKGCPVI